MLHFLELSHLLLYQIVHLPLQLVSHSALLLIELSLHSGDLLFGLLALSLHSFIGLSHLVEHPLDLGLLGFKRSLELRDLLLEVFGHLESLLDFLFQLFLTSVELFLQLLHLLIETLDLLLVFLLCLFLLPLEVDIQGLKHLLVVTLQLLNGLSLLLLQLLYGLIALPFKLHLLFLDLGIVAALLLLQASLIFVLQTPDLLLMRLLQIGYLLLVFLAELIGRGRQTGLFPLEAVLQLLDLLLEIRDLPLHFLLQEVAVIRRIPLELIHHPLVLLTLLFELLISLLLQAGLHVLEVRLELLCPRLQLEA